MSKITKSARGEDCQIRIPGICTHNPDETVFCHDNGAGLAIKKPDCEGAYGCSACHDVVDGRRQSVNFTRDQIRIMFFEGQQRTRIKLMAKGLIIFK